MEIRSREAIKAELIALEREYLIEAREIRKKIERLDSIATNPPPIRIDLMAADFEKIGKSRKIVEDIFEKLFNKKKDMEEKKFIKIEIPEGKELDEAAFKEGRIEWKDKAVTYDDVIKKLSDDEIILPHTAGTGIFPVFSQGQLNKLIALNKLMNVAKYLNGDWKFEPLKTKGYCIPMFANGKISVGYAAGRYYGDIYFKSEEDARKAIDILGEEVIRQALSTDY